MSLHLSQALAGFSTSSPVGDRAPLETYSLSRCKLPFAGLLSVLAWLLFSSPASAIILYSGDNSANQTAPTNGAPFYAVARICNGASSSTAGSAVYIRGKYLLTARHVANRDFVTFDGSTFYARDTAFTPVQVGGSTVDMKLIKLLEDPGLNPITLNESTSDDISVSGTLIGWGVGRDPNVADSGTGPTNIWQWGSTATIAKRWGTNTIIGSTLVGYSTGSYTALQTRLDRNAGSSEAGLAVHDSGSGIFIEDGTGWKLAGLTTAVGSQIQNASTFSGSGDANYFVRIASYAAQINAAIPNPASYSGWKTDHSLYNANADDDADPDGDGVKNLLEFALGGNPNAYNFDLLPTELTVEDGGSRYLELRFTRPQGLSEITYTVQTSTDLNTWPADNTGVNPSPIITDNGNGTETLIYRRSQAISGNARAYMRLKVDSL